MDRAHARTRNCTAGKRPPGSSGSARGVRQPGARRRAATPGADFERGSRSSGFGPHVRTGHDAAASIRILPSPSSPWVRTWGVSRSHRSGPSSEAVRARFRAGERWRPTRGARRKRGPPGSRTAGRSAGAAAVRLARRPWRADRADGSSWRRSCPPR